MVQRLARGQTQVLIYFTVEEAMGWGHNKGERGSFLGGEKKKKKKKKNPPPLSLPRTSLATRI